MGRLRGATVALVTAACLMPPGLASAEEFAFDLPKRNPKAMHAFQNIVPARFRSAAWIYRFEGTTSPLQHVGYHGRPFLLGQLCKPHDCGGNQVAFLIAADGSAAFGLLRSDELTRSQEVPFGAPDSEAQKLLSDQIPRS